MYALEQCFQGVALLSLNRQDAPRGTPQQTTRLRFVWRPPYDHGIQKSLLWRPIRTKSCMADAIHGSDSGRQTGVRRESWRAGEIGTRAERRAGEIQRREEHAGDLEGETAAAIDLRALPREEGEAEEREEGEAEGQREEQSSASGGEGSRARHPERGGGKLSSHSCGRAVVRRRNSSGERRR
jgi:hypothetical protein